MAKITVTVLPELYPVSGNLLFKESIYRLVRSPSWTGRVVLGFDKDSFPIRVGKKPPLVTFEPWQLISEDSQYLLISEYPIFYDTLTVSCFIKADNSGQIFPLDQNEKPIIDLVPNPNNFPEILDTENRVINISKLKSLENSETRLCVFKIQAPIRSKFSYKLTDITTSNINANISYYSLDLGLSWIPYEEEFIVSTSSYGIVLVYVNITQEAQSIIDRQSQNLPTSNLSFLVDFSIQEDIEYLTAEYGDSPNPSSEGQIEGQYLAAKEKGVNRIIGTQSIPIPYGTLKRCINNKGLGEFYGDSTEIIVGENISYSYQLYQGIHPICFK